MPRWLKPLTLLFAVALLALAANRWRAGDGMDWFSLGIAIAGIALVLFGPKIDEESD